MPTAFPSPVPAIPTVPLTAEMRDALRAIVGDKGLIQDEQDKQPFVTDWRGSLAGSAGAVVRPGSTEEVSKVVKLCHDNGIAIVPQAGNTGLMGGATPWPTHTRHRPVGRPHEQGADVDPVGYSMTVEAGCILQTLQETAAEHDRFLPLSLGAQGSCQIGGNLSTNAGGVQVLRYGNARNLVLGLEVVLPNGDIWNGLRALKKDNTGYDLKHLFMGAEGTLGIITKAVLKLWPAPKDVATAWLAVRDPQAAIEILSEAHSASEDNVGSCEMMSRAATEMVLRHIPGVQDPLKADTPWYLLMEWSSSRPRQDGAEGMSEKMEQFLAEQMEQAACSTPCSPEREPVAQHVAHPRGRRRGLPRRGTGPQLRHLGVDLQDPRVHRQGHQAALAILPGLRPLSARAISATATCISASWAPKGMDRRRCSNTPPAMTRAVNDLITSMAGSISAEHGIGIEKLDELQPLPQQDRARHHAHHQARARSEEHHESGQGAAGVMEAEHLAVSSAARVDDGVASQRTRVRACGVTARVGVIRHPHVAAERLLENKDMPPSRRDHSWRRRGAWKAQPVDARFNSGTTWPNTCSAAPQPQNDDGASGGPASDDALAGDADRRGGVTRIGHRHLCRAIGLQRRPRSPPAARLRNTSNRRAW